MERFVQKITLSIQRNHPKFSELDIKIIKFGLECIFGEGSKFLAYLIFFSFFSLAKEYLIAFLFFALTRFAAGGYHEKTYWRCFITSLLIFSSILGIAIYVPLPFWLRIFMSILSVMLMVVYAPVDHPNKPIISEHRRRKFKRLAIGMAILFSGISFFLSDYYAKIVLISVFLEALSLPAGAYMKRRMLYESTQG
ncbi:MAG TPA: accessory gene regulator B family protein [Clostridiales bacterium]|nr:accessory gene regulator B family protein [Clostridiales bacterium]